MEELCGAEWGEVVAPAVEGFESFLGPLLQAPIANGTIGYRRFGNTRSNRPALIMATGFGQTMGSWADGTLRTLAQSQEVIIFDHRGMGQSANELLNPAITALQLRNLSFPLDKPQAANETVAEFCGYPADTPGPQWPAKPLDFVGELQYANITEASVGYYRFGNTSGLRPPLVMVVGFAQTMGDWNASLMEELARDQEVIVFDNRGMGESKDYSSEPLTISRMAEDVVEFVESLDLDMRPNLMGVSMGGFITLTSAALYEDAFENFIMLVTSAGSPSSPPPTDQAQMAFLGGNTSPLELLNTSFPMMYPQAAEAACARYFHSVPIGPSFFFDSETWDAVPNITSNILLIGGENDVMVPVGGLKDIAMRAQSPWMVVYKHAGHGVLEQYHESIMGHINNFLDWVGVYGDE
ncbi:hypothetical protein QBZ16_003061 [Prototheca wickerhamii]|uniref:AB hydrolase-1 domain-containing protein n=1 Tax=Prototheca wickerhamii TaxID=3111 RepID=A0AAD9IMI1_PROWI|nr:hypothetical protein QBZ16_003061 [Prototheca wickerhamii]